MNVGSEQARETERNRIDTLLIVVLSAVSQKKTHPKFSSMQSNESEIQWRRKENKSKRDGMESWTQMGKERENDTRMISIESIQYNAW
jgi:hypothetical protein